ncbi:MAG: hypothetical protein CML13_10820 [Puniceicoccaceae bacterium]|nr:hypothetical protein [Puniceicoccaceae bacterium]|tara:strand:- start:53639 stop:54841 length:1203 start_codon:yes stop_codon:yes gene_type:complete
MFKPGTEIYIYPQPPRHADEVQSGVDRYLYALQQSLSCELKLVNKHDAAAQQAEGAVATANEEELDSIPNSNSKKSLLRKCIPSVCFLIYGYIQETVALALEMRRGVPEQSMIHVNRVGCELQTIAAKIAGVERVMTTVHNLPGEEPKAQHWFRRCIEWLSFACGDRHICVSHATFDAWHQRVGLRRDKVEIIYNGMTPPDYSQFDRDQYRSELLPTVTNAVWIGICARLHPMKGHAVLLQAFARLLQGGEHSEVALVIAGSGDLDQELQQLAKDLEIEDSVYFLGHRTDAIEFAAAIDINVLPSIHSETLGYSLIEAMFAARPSVVSDVGGMKELIQNSGGGKVVKAFDAEGLADALACYLSNPTQMTADGQKAQCYALEHLTADQMAAATMEAYAKLV